MKMLVSERHVFVSTWEAFANPNRLATMKHSHDALYDHFTFRFISHLLFLNYVL